jgi:hypothetical protein
MKNKTTLILGGVFLVLVIFYFLTSFHPREITEGATPLFKGAAPTFDKIEIINPKGDHIVMEKQNDVWNITSPITYRVAPQLIQQMIEGFPTVMIDGVVSSDPNEKPRFGVEDSVAVRFIATSGGKPVLDIIIGKFAPDLSHTYVRRSGKDDIELWRGIFARLIVRDTDEWRDRTIFNFSPGDITSMKVENGKLVQQLTLSDSTWTYTENGKPRPVDQGRLKDYVKQIATLMCDAFAEGDDIPRAGSVKPDIHVSFTIRNGDVHAFDLWTPKKESDAMRTLLRKDGGDILFRFYESRGKQLPLDYLDIEP